VAHDLGSISLSPAAAVRRSSRAAGGFRFLTVPGMTVQVTPVSPYPATPVSPRRGAGVGEGLGGGLLPTFGCTDGNAEQVRTLAAATWLHDRLAGCDQVCDHALAIPVDGVVATRAARALGMPFALAVRAVEVAAATLAAAARAASLRACRPAAGAAALGHPVRPSRPA
jgi:hypothetical protein